MKLRVKFNESTSIIKANFGEVVKVGNTADLQIYSGEYTVTPKAFTAQTLKTAQKKMVADVKIQKVPYFDVGNTAGGSTVYIANEV